MKEFFRKNFWTLICGIVVLTSIPSLIRIYNIRDLYLHKEIQNNAVAANIAMRNEYGIGATDLKLKKIYTENERSVFYFDYFYHGSRYLYGYQPRTYIIEFSQDKLVSIIEI